MVSAAPVPRLVAAEKTGRKARLIELDPKFCDVIVRRWEEYTSQKAQLFESHAESLNNQSSCILYEKKSCIPLSGRIIASKPAVSKISL